MGRKFLGPLEASKMLYRCEKQNLKHLYDDSKAALINLRRAGSSRGGMIADDMRRKRARFKCELKRCKAKENSLRSESLATELVSRNLQSFWKDIRRFTSNVRRLSQTVQGMSGELGISNLWRDKYSSI